MNGVTRLTGHRHLGWGWVGPYVGSLSSYLEGEEDPDEAVGKFVRGLGSLPDFYVKSDILALEENPMEWGLTISLHSSYERRDRWREELGFGF